MNLPTDAAGTPGDGSSPGGNGAVSVEPEPQELSLSDPALYLNRLLSHLQFNKRVLQQAAMDHPLLERLKFLLIFSGNMDEFFEIRVAQLKHQVKLSREIPEADGIRPREVLRQISEHAHELVSSQYAILNETIIPALAEEGIHFQRRTDWSKEQERWVYNYFKHEVLPVISPIGLDPAHPFPRLVNKSLNFIVELEGKDAFGRETGMAIVPAPRSLPRLIRLPAELCDDGVTFTFLSSVIHNYADRLFPGMEVKGCYQFRITRNADLSVDSDEVQDLALALRGELLSRRYGDAVRLETADNCPQEFVEELIQEFNLSEHEWYEVAGPVNLTRMFEVTWLEDSEHLQFPHFLPGIPKALKKNANIFAALQNDDVLLHHPFESFTPVVELLRKAASDPDVLAIKQTLYRTGSESEIVSALVEAARNGKEVTAVIEIRARFDEEENLTLASRLQEAGAVVVYGVVSYKTHAKMMLIVRREGGGLRRYAHLGTGNYHAGNARLYTDYSMLTSNPNLTEDVHKLFQQLTGMGKAMRVKDIFHAPFTLQKSLLELIAHEADNASKGLPARIIVKCNGLTDPKMIKALYKASRAGVQIDLIIRGMCCLRPGVPGVSDNIRVRSIIGRFLEHTRVFYFENNEDSRVFLSSADWMERNLLRRVETCFPVKTQKLRDRVLRELEIYLADNSQSWDLQSDGNYIANQPGEEERIVAQEILLDTLAI